MNVMKRNEKDSEFDKMLKENMGIILSICATFTGRKTDKMKDLYQDIVCRLWEGWGKFRNDSKVSTWVYRVALNTAISLWRKESRKPQFIPLPEELEQQLRDEPDNPLLNELYQLIDLLPKADRALIYLYIDGVSETEMASILGISPSSVGVRIHRIKQKLRDLRNKSWKTS